MSNRSPQADPLDQRATAQMLVEVSARKYARSLEPLPDDLDAFGTSKSAVSRRFVKRTTAQVEEFLQRRLDSLKLCVLMLNGVHVAEHVLLVAVGIDEQGNKHLLGMREGASENAVSCRELLCDLREREMHTFPETLTVMRLSLPDELVRHLPSTNLIENLIESVRTLSARGQNWRDVQMPLRWICATAIDAAKRFRTRYQRIRKSPRTHHTPP